MRKLYSHHCDDLFNHGSLLPCSIVLFKVHLVHFETCVQLLGHDGPFQYLMVGRINQVSVLCHHEAYKSNAFSILVEEDVRMGAVKLEGGEWGREKGQEKGKIGN